MGDIEVSDYFVEVVVATSFTYAVAILLICYGIYEIYLPNHQVSNYIHGDGCYNKMNRYGLYSIDSYNTGDI